MTKTSSPSPALDAPSERPAAKAATAAAASSLAAALEAAKTSVAKIHSEVELQRNRLAEIERLNLDKTRILADVENGNLAFDAGKKALGDASASIELLEHNSTRRAPGIAAEYAAARAEIVRLKVLAVGVLKRTSMRLIDERQAEVKDFLAQMGGTVSSTAWPVNVADLIAACPVLGNLEARRKQIDAWTSARPASELLQSVTTAEAYVSGKGLVEAAVVGADASEEVLNPPFVIAGWWPTRPGFDVLASCATKAEADEIMAAVETSSTFAGCRRVARLGGSTTRIERFASSRNAIVGAESEDRNFVRTQGYSGADERFLSDAATWSKLS